MDKDFLTVLRDVKQMGWQIAETIEMGQVEDNLNKCRVLLYPKVIDAIKEKLPEEVYGLYDEFFASFKFFCKKCNENQFLVENVGTLKSSIELFLECLEEIEVQYKEYNANATLVRIFLEKEGIQQAADGTRMLQFGSLPDVTKWITDNAPQVDCETTILFTEKDNYDSDMECISSIEAETYDLIICSYRLAWAQNDEKILNEIQRILNPNGKIVTLDVSEKRDFYLHKLGIEYFGETIFSQCELIETSELCVITKARDVSLSLAEEVIIDEKLCKDGPLVSVIMSCYNHGDFVADAIESVLKQSYKNIEFLVADDASTDNSVEVMQRYSQYFAKEFYFENNAGGRFQMLKQHAKGKYIAAMNSDDIWESDKLALQVKYMEEHEECGACFTWCKYIDENLVERQNNTFIKKNRSSHEWMRYFWEHGNALCNPSSLIRRDFSVLTPQYGSCSWQLPDFFKWIDLVQRCTFYVIPKTLIKMRRYKNKKVENVSAVTTENQLRHTVEEGCHWLWVIRSMDIEFFGKAFRKCFVNPSASTEQEIMCEKYFLMLQHKNAFVQHSALCYLAEIYNDVKDCLENTYQYSLKQIKEDVVHKGIGQGFQ